MLPQKLSELIEAPLSQDPCWIDPAVLPKGGTMVLGGCAKIGKSWVAIELARALSTGTPPFECPQFKVDQPTRVLLIDQELGENGLQARVKKVWARHRKSSYEDYIYYMTKVTQLKLDNQDGIKIILDACEAVRPEVLILDPISKFHNFEENSNAEILKLATLLETLKKAYASGGMSIIMSHHFRKPPTGKFLDDYDPLDPYNFRGSSNYYGDADTLLTLDRQSITGKSDEWKFKCRLVTRHGAEMPDFWLHVDPEGQRKQVWFEKFDGQVQPLNLKNQVP